MSTALGIARTIPNIDTLDDEGFAEQIHAVSVAVAEIAQSGLEPDQLMGLRHEWGSFINDVDRRRRKSTGKAEAAARLIEMNIGRWLEEHGERASVRRQLSPLTKSERADFRLFWRFRTEVTMPAVATSTNNNPATRWRVSQSVRRHRIGIGEINLAVKDVKRAGASEARSQAAENVRLVQAKMAEIERREKRVAGLEAAKALKGGSASNAYGFIRQALAEAQQCMDQSPTGRPDILNAAASMKRSMMLAEEHCLKLLAAMRMDEPEPVKVISVPDPIWLREP